MRKILYLFAALMMSHSMLAFELNNVAQNGARWRQYPVSFHLNTTNSGLVDSDVISTISESMQKWNNAVGSTILDVESTDKAVPASGVMDVDGINAIAFSVNFRIDSKGFDPQSAVAIAGQYGDGYAMTDAFVLFNAEYVAWDTDTARSSSPRSYRDDLPTIALHELGHTLGLGHSEISSAVMATSRQTKIVRTLTDDDIAGAKYVTSLSSDNSEYGSGSAAGSSSLAGGCGSVAYAGTGSNGGGNGAAGNALMMLIPMLVLLIIRKRALIFNHQ